MSPPSRIGAQTTSAVPVAGGSKQSQVSTQSRMMQTLAPLSSPELRQVRYPLESGSPTQLHSVLSMLPMSSMHAFHSPTTSGSQTGPPLLLLSATLPLDELLAMPPLDDPPPPLLLASGPVLVAEGPLVLVVAPVDEGPPSALPSSPGQPSNPSSAQDSPHPSPCLMTSASPRSRAKSLLGYARSTASPPWTRPRSGLDRRSTIAHEPGTPGRPRGLTPGPPALIGSRRRAGTPTMAKLYFRYGTMDSAKTLNLLAVAHNYRKQGKRVLLAKPSLDDRFGDRSVSSRAGLSHEADLLLEPDTLLDLGALRGADCVLVDEAQFLSPAVIDQLRLVTLRLNLPVICYGLRTDFQTRGFPGSLRLMEIADSIEEVKVTCQHCGRKAVFNLRTADGRAVVEGEQISLGDEEYVPVCGHHYFEQIGASGLAALGITAPRDDPSPPPTKRS